MNHKRWMVSQGL